MEYVIGIAAVVGLAVWLMTRKTSVSFETGDPADYPLNIKGESNYQKNIERAVGGRTTESRNAAVRATLIPEDNNPYDDLAVRVEIDSHTVGYLSKHKARKHRTWLEQQGQPGTNVECDALIVGGWDRGGGDRGNFGVKLNINWK